MASLSSHRAELYIGRICLGIALAGAAFLAWMSLTGKAIGGCGPGSGCNEVLSSRWAYWVGIPVSIPAFVIYLALWAATSAGESSNRGSVRNLAWIATMGLGALVIIAALWFGFLQHSVLRHWCRFCLATHSAGVAASVCLLHRALRACPDGRPPEGGASRSTALSLGLGTSLLAFVVLVAGQVLVKKRLYNVGAFSVQTGQSSRQFELFDGRFGLDPDDVPLVGSDTSPRFVVLLFDYTCSHCRRLHPLIRESVAHFKGQLAVIVLPAPLDSDCNPLIRQTLPPNLGACDYARLALAVWRARRSVFQEFDDWLIEADEQPSPDQARKKAESLVGKDALADALDSRWVKDQLKMDVQLYVASSTAMHNARLPQLIFADSVAYGTFEETQALEQLVDSHRAFTRKAP